MKKLLVLIALAASQARGDVPLTLDLFASVSEQERYSYVLGFLQAIRMTMATKDTPICEPTAYAGEEFMQAFRKLKEPDIVISEFLFWAYVQDCGIQPEKQPPPTEG